MKRFVPIILALSLFLSSCGALGAAAPAETTPTLSVEEIRATADILAYIMLTQTAAAMPTNTNTPVPPTETPIPEPTATATLIPAVVEDTSPTPEATAIVEVVPTSTTASTSAFPCTEKPLTGWDGESVNIRVTNNVSGTTANVFLCIVTGDDAGYISIPAGGSAQVPYGYFTATAWVTGEKNFNATIGFEVKTFDSLQIVIEDGRIYLRAGCYPNC